MGTFWFIRSCKVWNSGCMCRRGSIPTRLQSRTVPRLSAAFRGVIDQMRILAWLGWNIPVYSIFSSKLNNAEKDSKLRIELSSKCFTLSHTESCPRTHISCWGNIQQEREKPCLYSSFISQQFYKKKYENPKSSCIHLYRGSAKREIEREIFFEKL